MARREYFHAPQNFRFPFNTNAQKNETPRPAAGKAPISPIDLIARSMHTIKRFCSTSAPKNAVDDENPSKRQRYHRTNTALVTVDALFFEGSVPRASDDYFVPPERSRRNGMVFEDITLLTQNLPKSNTLPNRKTVINLADIDFSKPPPEWLNSTFLQTATNSRSNATRPPATFVPGYVPLRGPVEPLAHVIGFVTYTEFKSFEESIIESVSSLPSGTGFLQETLFSHAMSSLLILVGRAEDGLKCSWGTSRIQLPDHFLDAILFVCLACKTLAKSLTAEPPEAGEITSLSGYCADIVALVVKTANVVDALDLLNLIKEASRVKCTLRLTRAIDLLIVGTTRFITDVDLILEMMAERLDTSVPVVLLASRFRIHQALIEHHTLTSIYRIVTDSVVNKWQFDKIDKIRPIARRVAKQLDRMATEEGRPTDILRRQSLDLLDVKRDMIKSFFDACSASSTKASFTLFRMTSDIARSVGEPHVQAECLYRMAIILAHRGKSHNGITPNSLLISARPLNPSPVFQSKVQALLITLRRKSMSDVFDLATAIAQEQHLAPFVEGVKLFVRVLLSKYPTEGIHPDTVLRGDMVRGLLKIVRVFHPDKNSSADEDGRWVCEEITKVKLSEIISANR